MGDCGGAAKPAANVDIDAIPPSNAISVLVTGFGPFKSNPVNASSLIVASLPSSISFPPKAESNVGFTSRDIHIHTHPYPIPVSYESVRTELPQILEDFARKHNGRRPDLIMHTGIASTRTYYSVETQAHRDNYRITDINRKTGFDDGEKIWKGKGLPAVLKSGPAETLDGVNSVLSRQIIPYPPDSHFLATWKSHVPPGSDIRVSQDAGRYLCEFIFYTSLSQAFQEGRDRATVFYHVPSSTDEESLEAGKEIAIALIKTMVTCWIDEASQSKQFLEQPT